MSGSGGSCVASLILCSTISSSYSSLDPLCYDHQLTGLYLVRQLTINSLLIRQYIQSITSTQTCKISSLTEVTLTHLVNASSLRRSTDVPTPFHRLATLEFFILKFTEPLQRYLLTCLANSAFLGRFFYTGQQQL